jgi:hypothetical protein
MLKVVAISDVDPQNPPQAIVVHSFQHAPMCLCQRPHLITVDKIQNDKKAKNFHLGMHQEVAIPPHMGELRNPNKCLPI